VRAAEAALERRRAAAAAFLALLDVERLDQRVAAIRAVLLGKRQLGATPPSAPRGAAQDRVWAVVQLLSPSQRATLAETARDLAGRLLRLSRRS
jgi:hypothetical protein